MWFHMSGMVMMPVHSFSEALVDGENYAGRLDRKENRGYEHVLTLPQVRAACMGQNNYGPTTVWIPQFERAGSINKDEWERVGIRPAEYLLGLLLAHDSQLWTSFIHQEPVRKLWQALADADFGEQYEMIPYWAQDITRPFDEKEFVATFYVDKKARKTLMVLLNTSDRMQTVDIPIDFASLNLAGGAARAKNMCHRERVMIGAKGLMTKIPPYSFRLLLIQQGR
jgi:hypothetical protein